MFTKLLKHEWKATAGTLGVLSLGALGVGGIGAVLMRTIFNTVSNSMDIGKNDTFLGIMTVMMVFSILALVVYAIGSGIFLLIRFYKSKFTDEGYLTFTLPVSGWQIFLASAINIVIWTVIIGLVVALSVFAIAYFGMDARMSALNFDAAFEPVFQRNGALQILSSVISFCADIVIGMTCITIGAVLAKKHKLLASIGVYYLYSMVSGILYSVLMTVMIMDRVDNFLDIIFSSQAVFQLVMGIGCFFLSTYLMDKKLNLP